jgi:membrane protein DedA with SNARE-associated domain
MIAPALLASTAIILLSFVSEDAATISSALSIFGGPLSWQAGFVSCFTGIWLGDLGLYSLARWMGKRILRSHWLNRLADPATIMRCQQTFARNGAIALIASRFIPGTRLPTYLAAGFAAMPIARFAFLTALAALIWIGGIFSLTILLGAQTLMGFALVKARVAAVVITAIGVAGAILVLRRIAALTIWQRWRRWEFWPAWLFYIPVTTYYLWLSIRYRSFSLPSAANPGMTNGGFIGESKYEILKQLQRVNAGAVADAYLVEGSTTTARLLSLYRLRRQHAIPLPFILKPDVGQRGKGVRLIRANREAFEYLCEVDAPVLVQRYVPGPCEAGIFYYRFPDEPRGQIFAITDKIFPTITGNGVQTIEQLIRADPRAKLILGKYLERFTNRRHEILAAGETLKLVETGNHAQGCIFQDGKHLWSPELEDVVDQISCSLPKFFIGRYDVRYDTAENLKAGRGFQIVELNGATSEATNIYDPRNSLRSAYATLFRQWRLVFSIAAANRRRGTPPASLQTLWRAWRHYSEMALSYPCAD